MAEGRQGQRAPSGPGPRPPALLQDRLVAGDLNWIAGRDPHTNWVIPPNHATAPPTSPARSTASPTVRADRLRPAAVGGDARAERGGSRVKRSAWAASGSGVRRERRGPVGVTQVVRRKARRDAPARAASRLTPASRPTPTSARRAGMRGRLRACREGLAAPMNRARSLAWSRARG